jgi:hypothetical protein
MAEGAWGAARGCAASLWEDLPSSTFGARQGRTCQHGKNTAGFRFMAPPKARLMYGYTMRAPFFTIGRAMDFMELRRFRWSQNTCPSVQYVCPDRFRRRQNRGHVLLGVLCSWRQAAPDLPLAGDPGSGTGSTQTVCSHFSKDDVA